jgi:hypothetical protein
MFIQTMVGVVGINKTITVPFWLFIQTIVDAVGITKTITLSIGCLFTLL